MNPTFCALTNRIVLVITLTHVFFFVDPDILYLSLFD